MNTFILRSIRNQRREELEHIFSDDAVNRLVASCPALPAANEETLSVTACAYTLDGDQTDDSEDIGAWGDELDDETKTIAVSRDLLKMGMKRGTKVRIHGHPGEYVVET